MYGSKVFSELQKQGLRQKIIKGAGVTKMAKKLRSVWCKLDGLDPFQVTYIDGHDKTVYDYCFNLSRLNSSVHKLVVLCKEVCGLGHTHIPITNDSVGVAIETNSLGVLEVIFAIFYSKLVSIATPTLPI